MDTLSLAGLVLCLNLLLISKSNFLTTSSNGFAFFFPSSVDSKSDYKHLNLLKTRLSLKSLYFI